MSFYIFAENVFIHELLHFLVAVLLSLLIYYKYHSFRLVLVVWLVTFLIDLDHLTEWFLLYKTNFLYIVSNFNGGLFRESGKMTIFFHSWELLPLIYFVGKKINRTKLALVIIIAAAGHFLTDQIVYSSLYGMSLFEYFFTYRALSGFDFWKLCGGC